MSKYEFTVIVPTRDGLAGIALVAQQQDYRAFRVQSTVKAEHGK